MTLSRRFTALPFLVQAAIVTVFYLVSMRVLFGSGMLRPALAATVLWALMSYAIQVVRARRARSA